MLVELLIGGLRLEGAHVAYLLVFIVWYIAMTFIYFGVSGSW